ncbi:MAG: hypothetical protein WA957_12120 [Alteraurantiacibacter sp.]
MINEKGVEALWLLYSDNVDQSRHHENERAAIAGVVLTIGAAIAGLITYDGIIAGISDGIMAVLMGVVGLFGAAFSFKSYERSHYHFCRAREFRNAADKIVLNGQLADIQREADKQHKQKFGHFHKMKLHRWWIALNLLITLLAIAIGLLALSGDFVTVGVPL